MPYDTPQVDAAKIIGISSARMSQIHKQGMDKGTYRSKKNRRFYDMDKLSEALTRNLSTENQDRRGKKPGEKTVNKDRDEFDSEPSGGGDSYGKDLSFNEARRRNEWLKSVKTALEVDVIKGKLIDKDVVSQQAAGCAMLVKNTLLAVPDRLAALLAAETDADKIRKMLRQEFRQILDGIGAAI